MKKRTAFLIILAIALGLGCVIGASANAVATSIRSAVYSPAKFYFYGEDIPLKDSLVLITAEGETDGKLYMPARELLEYMNFQVDWDGEEKAVYLTMNGYNGSGGAADNLDSLLQNEADKTALDTMRRTGNWSYVEPYLPYMSREGIDAVAASYNSRHINASEHKRASDYYNPNPYIEFEPFGIEYDIDNHLMYYNSELVQGFMGEIASNGSYHNWYLNRNTNSGLFLQGKYENGKLGGVEIMPLTLAEEVFGLSE